MLIKNSETVANPWHLLSRDTDLDTALKAAPEYLLVPVQLWLDNREAFAGLDKTVGVWLDSDEAAEALEGAVNELPLIALNFPAFTDGRAFSSAVILRRHLHYTGELRAIGDVQRDLLFYMKRCGFDSFDLAENVKEADALNAFSDFHTSYQETVEEPTPLFRRRT